MYYFYCVLVFIGFLLLLFLILPKLFLKCKYIMDAPTDMGIKKINEVNGLTILYEPNPSIREYIPQYLVSKRNNKKQLMCRVNESISSIEYDVIVFDNKNKIVSVLTISEKLETIGYTKAVDLPSNTAYVSICLLKANNLKFPKRFKVQYKRNGAVAYSVLQSILLFACMVLIRRFLALQLGDVFAEELMKFGSSFKFLLIAVISCVVEFIVVMSVILRRSR